MAREKKNLSIKKRLSKGFLLIVNMMALSGIISILGLAEFDKNFNDFVNRTNRADTAVKMCRIDINIAARTIREMTLAEDSSNYANYKAKVEETLTGMNAELLALKETGVIDEDLRQQYVNAITEWGTLGYEIIGMIENGELDAAKEKIFSECVPKLDGIIELSQELDATTNDLMDKAVAKCQVIFWFDIISILAFIVAAMIFARKYAMNTIKSITDPLEEIEKLADELAEGNLHSTIEYHSEDEIGKLAHSLRKSVRTLASYVDDITNIMDEFSKGNFTVQSEGEWEGDFIAISDSITEFEKNMSKTLKSIQSVAEQVSMGAEQVSDSSTELAQGATDQASITEELAATIETTSGEISMSAEIAKATSKKVEDSGLAIIKSNEKMQEMVQSMNEISEASQKIHQIIDTINDIASQTNLLALNASIEAARAGEAGRGFAVVADQVSVLAAQSAEAVKESNVLIESSLEAIEKGIVIADETASQLEGVVAQSQEITEVINKAAEVLGTQAEGFEQIIAGVDHINDVVQANSATSEECAASSEEMSSQAQMLEELVHNFKISEDEA